MSDLEKEKTAPVHYAGSSEDHELTRRAEQEGEETWSPSSMAPSWYPPGADAAGDTVMVRV